MRCTSHPIAAMLAIFAVATVVSGGVVQQQQVPNDGSYVHEEEVQGPPVPYSFSYSAGRRPGHVDRVHSESRDVSGVVRGEFSYVDPRHRVRTVAYIADENGFHPTVNGGSSAPLDTPVVAAAKLRHLALKDRIAAEHAAIGAEHARLNAERAALNPPLEQILDGPQQY